MRNKILGEPVRVPINGENSDVILTSAVEGQGFVSIDGKRTYLNLFESTDQSVGPTKTQFQATRTQAPPLIGSGCVIVIYFIISSRDCKVDSYNIVHFSYCAQICSATIR